MNGLRRRPLGWSGIELSSLALGSWHQVAENAGAVALLNGLGEAGLAELSRIGADAA